MARLKASSLALEGLAKPLSFRTNCSEDARISSSVAGGLKLCRVLMFRHIVFVFLLTLGCQVRTLGLRTRFGLRPCVNNQVSIEMASAICKSPVYVTVEP